MMELVKMQRLGGLNLVVGGSHGLSTWIMGFNRGVIVMVLW